MFVVINQYFFAKRRERDRKKTDTHTHRRSEPQAQTSFSIASAAASPTQFGVDFQDGCFTSIGFCFLFETDESNTESPREEAYGGLRGFHE